MTRPKTQLTRIASYGIAEWYGRLYRVISGQERAILLDHANDKKGLECRFMADVQNIAADGGVACIKKGGVCSIRSFQCTLGDEHINYGPLTTKCPIRFLEGGVVISEIAHKILETDNPLIARRVPFPIKQLAADDRECIEADNNCDNGDGQINMILVHPTTIPLHWCAVEFYAAYFSDRAISYDFNAIRTHPHDEPPMPSANRAPDFRSIVLKRLIPQLQIKVQLIRRWGKKMVVVVDRQLFNSLGPIKSVNDVSNSDIAWLIVKLVECPEREIAKLEIDEVRYTTLEDAIQVLTAGVISLPEFEANVRAKIL